MHSKLLFLLCCIPARTALAVAAYKIPAKALSYLSIPLFIIGLSFIYLYLFNKRLNAPEAGGETWWRNLRPIHGMLYITAAIYAIKESRIAAIILFADVIFGLTAFLLHNYS